MLLVVLPRLTSKTFKKMIKFYCIPTKKGIIVRGIASGQLFMKDDNGEPNAEYYLPLINFTELIKPIPSHKLRDILLLADSQEARPFNKTSLKFQEGVLEEIWKEICRYM
ncbi:hypothetical protein ACU82A_11250 [Bacillus cereus]